MEICDNKSVGVIIENSQKRILLIKRARLPIGYAPPAGHVDDHGMPLQAATTEVGEEVGLRLTPAQLKKTTIQGYRVNNVCRRPGGHYHDWWIYTAASFTGSLRPSPHETEGAQWYSREQLQALADRTRAYQAGRLSREEWEANPGLEPMWLTFLTELGYTQDTLLANQSTL